MAKQEKKELYSLKEVSYLKEHYKGKVIGRMYDETTKTRIDSLFIKDYGKGFYDLKCVMKLLTQQSVLPIIDIKSVAEKFDIESPKDVLKNQNLPL